MVAPGPLRVVFLGTPAFAVPTLEALLASRHEVVGVVTQPDRPRGRGQKSSAAPVKAVATGAGLPVLQPAKMKDESFLAELAGFGADIGVVAAYGRILTDAVLAIPRLGMINVHASLLPKYRGAAPVHRAVMAGDEETGVTIMRVVRELDAGPMLAKVTLPIGPDDTSATVEAALARAGAPLLLGALDALAIGAAVETPQNDSEATLAPRITREDAPIDWTRPARALHDQVRGLHPWPHAETTLDGARLIVHRTAVEPDDADAAPGTVVDAAGDVLRVATGSGVLRLLEVQPEGRRVMDARSFLAGHALAPGTRVG